MKTLARLAFRFAAVAAMLTLLALNTVQAASFITVDLGSIANDQLDAIQPGYPVGLPVILGGVPFHIEPTGDNIYNSNIAAAEGPGTVSVNVPIGLSGVAAIHTLINTGWGQPGPDSFASLTFHFSDSTDVVHQLIGDVDIRDHFNGLWTNSIGGSTTNVFSTVLNGHAGVGEYRIDKQRFDLSSLSDKTLVSITLMDSGDLEFQRTYLFGVTVEAVPEPSSILLATIAGCLAVSFAILRRRPCQ